MESHGYQIVKTEETDTKNQKEQNYCSCNEPYDPALFYIQCEQCDQWLHGKCASITKDTSTHIVKWFCSACQEKGNQIQWKPKCAKPDCTQLSRSSSIYCSSQCKMTIAKSEIKQYTKSLRPRQSKSGRNTKIESLKGLVDIRKQREQFIRLLEKRQLLIDLCIERKHQLILEFQQKICGFDERICTDWVRSLKHLDELPDSLGTELQNGKAGTLMEITKSQKNEDTKEDTATTEIESMEVDPPKEYCQLGKCPRHEGWEYTKSAEVEAELEEQVQLYYQEKVAETGLKVALKN
ncbi:hypothetical protein HDV01_001279 [Terramyces sp. JEL0728]|nr:hypothetical protein HDV01_001279 [Terramyces sp. JEL0728]